MVSCMRIIIQHFLTYHTSRNQACISNLKLMMIKAYYKTCEDLRDLIIEKLAHISSINLQVECAPLRCCARPRPAVRTGGAAKQEKGPQSTPKTT